MAGAMRVVSPLFRHRVKYGIMAAKPVQEVEWPAINRWEGVSPAFSPQQANAILHAPDPTTVESLRDGAIRATNGG